MFSDCCIYEVVYNSYPIWHPSLPVGNAHKTSSLLCCPPICWWGAHVCPLLPASWVYRDKYHIHLR